MQSWSMRSWAGRCRAFGLIVAAVAAVIALAACGGSSGEDSSGGANSSEHAGLITWPYFGRVPERTQYLPEHARALNPPLKRAWSINTHALIEFPPAVVDGVAYVVNKYGNAKAVRLRDRKVLWERNPHPRDSGKPTDVTAPVYHEGKVFFADVNGDLLAVDAGTGKPVWDRRIPGHLESSPVAVGGTLYLGTDTTNLLALRASDGKLL